MGFYPIPRSDMCMSDPMPFSQHWDARVPVPISSIDDIGRSLQAAYTSLKPGDLVHMCSFERNDWTRLTEVASFRVVSCDNSVIETVQVSDTIKVPAKRVESGAEIAAKYEIIKMGHAFEVRDGHGNTIEVFVAHDQAVAFIETMKNKSRPNAPSLSTGRGDLSIKRGFAGKFIVTNQSGEPVKEFPNKAAAEQFISAAA